MYLYSCINMDIYVRVQIYARRDTALLPGGLIPVSVRDECSLGPSNSGEFL